jgi:AraC-like DNA-binding protein
MPATHAHDFLQIVYVATGRHTLRVEGKDWVLTSGDVLAIAPGSVITTQEQRTDEGTELWSVLISTDAIDPSATTLLPSWRAHPLLSSFASTGRGSMRTRVPQEERETCESHLVALQSELGQRGHWYADAARAHLTLFLVQLSRLDFDLALDADREALLAAVFKVIESRYQQPISLSAVATEVAQSKGHLASVVKRRTGRTVGQWIAERRMREARRLLADTNLTITAIASQVGFHDPGYFTRRFRLEHEMAPQAWRQAGRLNGGQTPREGASLAHRD